MIVSPFQWFTPDYFLTSFPAKSFSCDLMTCRIRKSALRLMGALNTDIVTQTGRKKVKENGWVLIMMTSADTIRKPL